MPLHAKPNKPIYVRKYDFLRSFFRPESHWFWPTTKIDEELSELIRATNSDYVSETEDDDGEGEFSTYDSLEEFLTLKEENISKNIDMDENDPKIIEGQILDELAKKHIIEEYELCEVIDFDCKEYKQKALDELCEITISILRDKNNVILFQPTFIAKNKAIAKPDAIVIFNSKTYLIETKGSAKVKASHIIDLIYQDKVVNDCLRQNDLCEIDDFYMCIVATERAKKGEVTFILTNNICFNKSGSQSGISQLKKMGIDKFDPEYLAYKQQICIANSPFDENPTFTYNDFRYKLNDLINQIIPEKLEKFYNVYDDRNFWDTIDIIIGHQPTSDLNFEPEEKFSCFFKDNDNILSLKNYYYTTSVYHSFGYSGYLIPWKRSFELAQFYNQKKTYSPHDVLLIAKDHIKSKIFDRISNFIQLDDKIYLSSY